jgi:murein DD-endopeptidase MepM/ murein hydrolase activator NlpD
LKRTWTKKTKGLPNCKIGKKAQENQLQPKVRIFRTSAALIGLTVSVGTPNLLLTQAAPLPQTRSNSAKGDRTAPEIVQVVPLSALLATPQVVPSAPYSTAKEATASIYNHPAPVVESSAPTATFTPALQQPSKELVPQPPVASKSLALRLRQHQQASASERTQAVTPLVASNPQNFTPIETRKEAVVQNQAVEIDPAQIVVASSSEKVRSSASALALSPLSIEANSGWTAKQRLLVDRLKNTENPSPSNNPQVIQVPNNIDLAPPVTILPTVVAAPSPERTLPEDLESQALVATSDQSQEFAAPLQTDPTDVAATVPGDSASALAELRTATQPPVFVQPSVAPANTTPTEVTAVDEQQVASQVPEEVENSSPIKEIVTSVNEPIIVSAATSEYQVKPGDTLMTIASAHRLSLPEVAKFNHLSDPDLLLVDQKIKIPSLNSMTTRANVAVLPPIEKVEPTAQTNPLPVVAIVATTAQEVVPTTSVPAYTGVGGNLPGEVEAKPLEPTALNALQAQYAQKLQNDVQKLKQKYQAQNGSNPLVPVQAAKGEVLQQIAKPSAKLDDEPINPEFRVAQTYQDLKPVTQKQLINRVNYSAPASVGGRVATAPVSGDNSNESFPVRQVIPELPPLDPAMNYLPQPNGVAPLNGYMWPARGALTSGYGWRWGRMHRGIDIAAPVGTPIFAAAPGVVIKAGWNKGGYGNLVDIQHADGSLTRYAHNYRLLVQPGQFVDQGQQISLMGSTGRSTGPHLHFEVHPGGKGAINPIALLPKSK